MSGKYPSGQGYPSQPGYPQQYASGYMQPQGFPTGAVQPGQAAPSVPGYNYAYQGQPQSQPGIAPPPYGAPSSSIQPGYPSSSFEPPPPYAPNLTYQQPQPVYMPGAFDAGARFDGIAQPRIPPPPPGCSPNAAQYAALQGGTVVAGQQKADWVTGGTGGGTTFW